MQKWLICAVMALGFTNTTFAQSDYDAKVKAYVDKYKDLAVAEQKRSGIPACITLAQGIHETQAGYSELATMANNHFGIKCKKEWTGETFAHTDDAPNECFRKYSRSEDSYKDHSDYLVKSPRYAELFKLSITDYPAWALGLKKCGYATNPKYAQVLIKLVEDYHLQEFTYAALNNAEIIPEKDPVMVPPVQDKPAVAATPVPVTPPPAAQPVIEPPVTKTVQVSDAPVTAAKEPEVKPEPKAEEPAAIPVASTPVTATPVAVETPAPATTAAADPIPTPPVTIPATSAPAVVHVAVEQAPAAPQPEEPKQRPVYGKEIKVNGLKAIYGHKGETPLGYAYNAGIRYAKLLDVNEIDERPLPVDMYLYLEKKHTVGQRETHTVKAGETLFMVAQEEGMQIKSLMEFNLLEQGEEPLPGTVLQLQQTASEKPALRSFAGKNVPPTRIKTSGAAYTPVAAAPVPVTPPATTTRTAAKPIRNKNIKVSDDYSQPATNTTPPPPPVAVVQEPAAQEIAKPAATLPVAEVIEKQSSPVAFADPTAEEAGKGYPKQAESRYTIPDEVAKAEPKAIPVQAAVKEEIKSDAPEMASAPVQAPVAEIPKPEPVKELPVSAEPEAMATTPVRQKTNNIVTESPKPVAVPDISEEPQDDIDKLKRKFDRVVYADANKGAAPNPIMPASAPVTTPKSEVTTPVTPAAKTPLPEVVIDPKDAGKYYTVKKGDTGFNIARKNNITLTQLMKWNNMDFGNVEIREGQKLKVKP